MKAQYDFSEGVRGKYDERMRKEGYRVTVRHEDGTSSTRYFPPGVVPSSTPAVHVYPTRSGWAVRTETASRASRTVKSQEEAVQIGIRLATGVGAELIVHPRSLLVGA